LAKTYQFTLKTPLKCNHDEESSSSHIEATKYRFELSQWNWHGRKNNQIGLEPKKQRDY
jgi:hypothetical protein